MTYTMVELIEVTTCPKCEQPAPKGGIAGRDAIKMWWCDCGHKWEEPLTDFFDRTKAILDARARVRDDNREGK